MPPSDGRRGPTRQTPLVLLIVAGVLLVARVATGIWYEVHPGKPLDEVNWAPAPAPGRAAPSGKPVLYVFIDDSQDASQRLEREVFADARAAQMLESAFVPVRVSSSAADGAVLRARFGVTELPACVVTSPDGGRFRTIAGYTNAGALMDSLSAARMEMADLPFIRGRTFRFGVGGPAGIPGGTPEPDSAAQQPGR